MTTRFAPSPTGLLHVGHAFAARVAREAGSKMLLRYEDIDHTRVREEYYDAIERDLQWLGIAWDEEPIRQLDRLAKYEAALEKLKILGVVYPCYSTRREIREELDRLASAPQEGALMPSYPPTLRQLSAEEQDQRRSQGIEPAWRLDAEKAAKLTSDLTFHDQRHGEVSVQSDKVADVILARKDIGTSYHLAVVVDDAEQNIDLVTRGEDLLDSTHVHRVLQALLDLPEPQYLHHELIRDDAGTRLAKRDNARSIASLREGGMTAKQVWQLCESFRSADGER